MTLHLSCGRLRPIVCPPSGMFVTSKRDFIIRGVGSVLLTLTYIIGGTQGYHWYTELLNVPGFTRYCPQIRGINLAALYVLLRVRAPPVPPFPHAHLLSYWLISYNIC